MANVLEDVNLTEAEEFEFEYEPEEEKMLLNFGPSHPATHGRCAWLWNWMGRSLPRLCRKLGICITGLKS